MNKTGSRLLDLLTFVAVVVAIQIGWSALNRPVGPGEAVDREVSDFDAMVAGGHRVGASDPTVTVVVWYDYECPVCRSVEPRLAKLLATYPDDVALVYRHYPLSYHDHAYTAAVAVECAAAQGGFEPYHMLLLETDEWMGPRYRETFVTFADSLGLDPAHFGSCLEGGLETHPRVEADMDAARAFGARGTPAIVVNGVYLAGMPRTLAIDDWRAIGRTGTR